MTGDRTGVLPARLPVLGGDGISVLTEIDAEDAAADGIAMLMADAVTNGIPLSDLVRTDAMFEEEPAEEWPRNMEEIRRDLETLGDSPDRDTVHRHLTALQQHLEDEFRARLEAMTEEDVIVLVEELPEERLEVMKRLLTGRRSAVEHQIDTCRFRHRSNPTVAQRLTEPFRGILRMITMVLKAVKQRLKEVARLQSRTPVPIGA
jgi:hypothetical protein